MPTFLVSLVIGLVPVALCGWRWRARARKASTLRRSGAVLFGVVAWISFAMAVYMLAFAEGDRRARNAAIRRESAGGRNGLAALISGERAYFGEKDRYAPTFAEVGFETWPDDPFTYALGKELHRGDGRPPIDPVERCRFSGTWPDGTPLAPGLFGTCPDCHVAALAVNVTARGETICWSAATVERRGPDGITVPARQVVYEPSREKAQ